MRQANVIPCIIDSLEHIDVHEEVKAMGLTSSLSDYTLYILTKLYGDYLVKDITTYEATLKRAGCKINLNLNPTDLVACYNGSIELILNLAVNKGKVIFESIGFYNIINILSDREDIKEMERLLDTLNLKSNIDGILTSICTLLKMFNKKYIIRYSNGKELTVRVKTNLVHKESNLNTVIGYVAAPNYISIDNMYGGGVIRVGDD